MKSNIEKGGGGSIVEIRKEIRIKYSNMAKCLCQHFCCSLSEGEKPLLNGNETLFDLDTNTRYSN